MKCKLCGVNDSRYSGKRTKGWCRACERGRASELDSPPPPLKKARFDTAEDDYVTLNGGQSHQTDHSHSIPIIKPYEFTHISTPIQAFHQPLVPNYFRVPTTTAISQIPKTDNINSLPFTIVNPSILPNPLPLHSQDDTESEDEGIEEYIPTEASHSFTFVNTDPQKSGKGKRGRPRVVEKCSDTTKRRRLKAFDETLRSTIKKLAADHSMELTDLSYTLTFQGKMKKYYYQHHDYNDI